jgi:hypothetical protein
MRRPASRTRLLLAALWGRGSGKGGLLGTALAAAAGAAGIFTISLSVQLAVDLEGVFSRGTRNLPDREYLVVSKRVDLGMTITPARTVFSEAEIGELRSMPGVFSVNPVVSNRFAASLFLDFGGFELGTELFFESVPDAFLGEVPSDWHWAKGERTLPILISRDFLALYNLGFASSRGLPPVSESMLGMVGARAAASGPGGTMDFEAKIVGLTDRLSSILVPESFMSWANGALALEAGSAARRLIVETEPRRGAELDAFLKARDWERMREGGAAAGILGIGRTALILAGAVGALLSALAIGLMAFSLSLAVERSRGPIGVLRLLGYSRARLGALIGASGGIGVLSAAVAGAAGAVLAGAALRSFVSRTLGQTGPWGFPSAALLVAGGLSLLFLFLLPAAGFALIAGLERADAVVKNKKM